MEVEDEATTADPTAAPTINDAVETDEPTVVPFTTTDNDFVFELVDTESDEVLLPLDATIEAMGISLTELDIVCNKLGF